MSDRGAHISITDVTLRDGLQMEKALYNSSQKKTLFDELKNCGFDRIEITSFVSPKWVPQFQDSMEFCQSVFQNRKEIDYTTMAFVPNLKGLDRLLNFPIGWVSAFVATSEAFNQKNVNQSISDSLKELEAITVKARKEGRRVRLYLSTVFGCPYEKDIPIEQVEKVFRTLANVQPDEIALGDTIGVAVPAQVGTVLERLVPHFPKDQIAVHFHNTYGQALANCEVAFQKGIRSVDGSVGGIGGCPYAKGASGNMAIEDYLWSQLRQKRIKTFPKKGLVQALGVLKNGFSLPLRSQLGEVWARGGEWYGVQ